MRIDIAMKSKSRKSNYSPVKHMVGIKHKTEATFQDEFPPIEIENSEARFQASNSSYSNRKGANAVRQELEVEDCDHTQQPEEVYICDCCGVTRQLSPAIEFMSTFKSLFFLFNFLAFVLGFASVGMGLWFRIDPKVYEIHKYIETQNFTLAGWIMLFAGFITCLVALAGFVGASKQVAGLLLIYLASMVALLLAFVATLVLLSVYGLGSTLQHFLTKEIYEQIRRRSMNSEPNSFNSNEAAQFLDFIQVKMRCCGAADLMDYAKLGMVIPTSCYAIDKNYNLAPGCGRAIRDLLDLRAGLAIGISSASILTQLFTITLAALMFCSIYHWRANARPVTPVKSRPGSPVNIYHQRARSRTPIVI